MAAFYREHGYAMCTHMYEQGLFALQHLRDLIISNEVRDRRVLRNMCNAMFHNATRTLLHMHDYNILVSQSFEPAIAERNRIIQALESEITERNRTIEALGFRVHQLLSCPPQPVGNVFHENEIETSLIGLQNQVDLLSRSLDATFTGQAGFRERFDVISRENTTTIQQLSAENSTLRDSSSPTRPADFVVDENEFATSFDGLLTQLDLLSTSLEATSTGQARVHGVLDAVRIENAILKEEIETLGRTLDKQEQLLKDARELNALQNGNLIQQEQELNERTLQLKGTMRASQQNARELQQKAEQLKHALSELEELKKKAISTTQSFSKQAAETDKQRQEIVRLKDSISNFQIELASAGDESQSQRKELATLAQKLAATEEEMLSKQMENSKLTTQVGAFQKRLEDFKTWDNTKGACDLDKLRTQIRSLEEAKRIDDEIKLQLTMDHTGMKKMLEERNARIERLNAEVARLISAKIPEGLNDILVNVVKEESKSRKVSENMSFFVVQLQCEIQALKAQMETEGDAGIQCATNDLVQKSFAEFAHFKKAYTKKRDELEAELVGLRAQVILLTEQNKQMNKRVLDNSKRLCHDLEVAFVDEAHAKLMEPKEIKKGRSKRN